MFKQSFIMFVVAGALTAACDARNVNTNRGPSGQDAARPNPGSDATTADRTGQGTTRAASTMSVEDQQFVQKAMTGGRKEVELGRLAQSKASSDQVKQLGEKIADDHERANRELESMATGSDVARTSETSGSDDERGKLERLTGAAFDRAYLEQMIADHQKDITEFERASRSSNETVRTFAEKTIPTLRQHLRDAQDAQSATATRK